MKGIIADKYLLPIREQIIDLILPNADVLDFGCGNGDLLFKLSHKIKEGIGFDNSKALISYAMKKKALNGISNIDFKLIDLCKDSFPNRLVNYSIASLFLHVLSKNDAYFLLKQMINISEVTIVCGLSKPENLRQSFLLYMDQKFSGHYSKFKVYKENNYMEGLLESLSHICYESYSTFDPVIKIYKITKLNKIQLS
ncbi:class I SAM-dependent methyltransferase [Pontimicrobium sp. SW4]|uniref:Class I SAM-dependent methyltransferase n=1 Tax=Pontimicrobium sp. SW4 TaxID=3153519 RepID=A0AAU7BU52_9FLAO